MEIIEIRTDAQEQALEITRQVQKALDKIRLAEGAVLVYCPHTTAAVTVNEHADSTVMRDVLFILGGLAQKDHPSYRHLEGNSHAHGKAVLVGESVLVPVSGGKILLGTWQGIFLMEFDGPRSRRLYIQPLASLI